MGKKSTALEEISDQELNKIAGGAWADTIAYLDWLLFGQHYDQTASQPSQGGGSCSVQDVMNDRC